MNNIASSWAIVMAGLILITVAFLPLKPTEVKPEPPAKSKQPSVWTSEESPDAWVDMYSTATNNGKLYFAYHRGHDSITMCFVPSPTTTTSR